MAAPEKLPILFFSFEAAAQEAKKHADEHERPYFIFRESPHWVVATRQPVAGIFWVQKPCRLKPIYCEHWLY